MRRNLTHIAVVLALAFGGAAWADSVYHARSIAPGHRLELQRCIAQMRASLKSTNNPDARSKLLEELCKKLIQAEEYDDALATAREVVACEGADVERRAVHHFLVAQIYAMRMEASPSVELMEENRQLAIRTAQEVIARHYPRKWLISESATQLIQSLTDPQHLREVRGWVEKRQNDPAFESKLRVARVQSAQIDRLLSGGGAAAAAVSNLAPDAGRGVVSRGTASVSYSRAAEQSVVVPATKSAATRPQQGAELHAPVTVRGPIVIDGNRVHRLQKLSSSAASIPPSPYAPGAEPQISAGNPPADADHTVR
jgi:hypothetical protein